jgi:hypothetical protein
MPPPTAVSEASTIMPKISIRRCMATMAPDIAKAIVPMISKITQVKLSIKI